MIARAVALLVSEPALSLAEGVVRSHLAAGSSGTQCAALTADRLRSGFRDQGSGSRRRGRRRLTVYSTNPKSETRSVGFLVHRLSSSCLSCFRGRSLLVRLSTFRTRPLWHWSTWPPAPRRSLFAIRPWNTGSLDRWRRNWPELAASCRPLSAARLSRVAH